MDYYDTIIQQRSPRDAAQLLADDCRKKDEENALLLASNTQLIADLLQEKNKTEHIRQGLVTMMDMMAVGRVNG